MKYLFTLWGDESRWSEQSPEEAAADMARWDAFTKEVEDAGVMRGGEGLEPTSSATTLRIQGSDRVVTDGPFAETKEQLGGYYLLDCKDLDEALEWARKIPVGDGSIEIRPVLNYEAYASADAAGGEATTA